MPKPCNLEKKAIYGIPIEIVIHTPHKWRLHANNINKKYTCSITLLDKLSEYASAGTLQQVGAKQQKKQQKLGVKISRKN